MSHDQPRLTDPVGFAGTDGAGQAAFLKAWDKEFGEPSRRRLQAAMQAWERKRTDRRGGAGSTGA